MANFIKLNAFTTHFRELNAYSVLHYYNYMLTRKTLRAIYLKVCYHKLKERMVLKVN